MSRKRTPISELNTDKIGGRIAYIRISNDESQAVFSKKTGLSKGNLSGLENHKYEPSFQAIVKILEIYNEDPQWLLFGPQSASAGVKQDGSPSKKIKNDPVEKFQQKELAQAVTDTLIKLEKIDPGSLREIKGYIDRILHEKKCSEISSS